MTMLYRLDGVAPRIDPLAYVAPGARLIGNVVLRAHASVWFNAVLRGDNEPIELGTGSNVQDGCICHADPGFPLTLGADVTVGHMAILHGCTIGDGALIGMGSTVLNGATIGAGALVGAGSLVTEGKEIPPGVLAVGRPVKVVRELTEDDIAGLLKTAEHYRKRSVQYAGGLTPA